MELNELAQGLGRFCKAHYPDEAVEVCEVFQMPGHAGFSYGFSVETSDLLEKWYLRLPPPIVKLEGTADVLRQVAALNALPATVPHCQVRWSGSDPQWFGRPYFIVPQLQGDVVRQDHDAWVRRLDNPSRTKMARQAVTALAEIHRVDPGRAPYLGEPIDLALDVSRWDRFVEKAADPSRLVLVPEVKRLLLDKLPTESPMGIFHGDFQWSNLFYSKQGELLAVIDWELVGVGATLNDVGWFATFNDPLAWSDTAHQAECMPQAEVLIAMYKEAWGAELPNLNWFRALAAYKFAIITGFNLMLHRRGKRHDPLWETSKNSMETLLHRAQVLLS
ncbi:MAG: phosphotransferase family protein [Proteobacteria bacterium]|nr:phosphotransferase family protein [Pseudomonadota bacterium]